MTTSFTRDPGAEISDDGGVDSLTIGRRIRQLRTERGMTRWVTWRTGRVTCRVKRRSGRGSARYPCWVIDPARKPTRRA